MNKLLLIFSLSLILIGTGSYAFAEYVDDPVVVLETNSGNITIEFFSLDAPNHRTNFIVLAKQGYYDGTLFHRIIPGFMIQGGDPNTISGSSTTWGLGGPENKLDSEFNDIKHNRGIVSMARSADPNSAGSQFFIVHKDSNFLDGEYTVFGRIVTEESFETLDKIAALETTPDDKPINAFETRIIKTTVVERSNISKIMDLGPPERIGGPVTQSTGNQIFESKELDIAFSAPEGWLLQQSDGTNPNAPDVVAVGPKIGGINPVISLTIQDTGNKTIDDLITEKNNILDQAVYAGDLEILSQNTIKSNVYQTEATAPFVVDEITHNIKFLDVMIHSDQKSYTFTYSNTVENFDDQMSRFNESLDSFEILSQESPIMESSQEEGGGCLIATATYGSELAPQVQMLREIRDNQLMNTESGTVFMSTFNNIYYSFSPIIADYERENPLFKKAVKLAITPMISTLTLMENAETESEVLSIGISVIMLNLGMYLAVPAIVIFGIRKRN
ncbi:peptidylprolyl isomerase [Nitrosopumilus sp.]|nr:peptidylprolyl isomerase [Nitrosopumilus sp.]MDC0329550.1 peptidylprolyl isomerase [Nitrosopumilus sp.]